MTSLEPELEEMLLAQARTEEGRAEILAYLFMKVTEINATLTAMLPVLGAIAGRVGIAPDEVRELSQRERPK